MSNAGPTPAPLRPSVFISYSSEDRDAARALRDTLAATGLEVWYDENELGGGDAWDQKIRRQIRDCDYFMPVISSSTERRKEGYFRREWRLAVERTLDMADDVLFLLPVVIDDTSEAGARVPDKFLTVQWLRAPGGQSTPALEALSKRLLAGEHTIQPRPPLIGRGAGTTRPPMAMPPMAVPPPVAQAEDHSGPPPMPPFPHHEPKSGHWPRYVAEVLWWIVTALWVLITRMPKFVRVILAIWVMVWGISMCKSSNSSSNPPRRSQKSEDAAAARIDEKEIEKTVQNISEQTAEAIKAASKDGKAPDFGRVAEEMARRFNRGGQKSGGRGRVSGKSVVVVPFVRDQQDPAAAKFVQTAFSTCFGHLVVARPSEATVSTQIPGTPDDEALKRIGQEAGATYVLSAHPAKGESGVMQLEARVIQTNGGTVWSAEYPIGPGDAAAVGREIGEAVLKLMPIKPPEPPQRPKVP